MKIQCLFPSIEKQCIVFGTLTCFFFAGASVAMAKENKAVQEQPAEPLPITVWADHLTFNDQTGDILARGSVRMVQGKQVLHTMLLQANSKTMDVWITDEAEYQEPNTVLFGEDTRYNWGSKKGEIKEAHGTIGDERVNGKTVHILPDKYIIDQGTMTRCPAKKPDYHMSADRVEIWPYDKMIAYNAKFWVKGRVVYQQTRYVQSLKSGANETAIPRIGYDNDDGAYIAQRTAYPLDEKDEAFLDWGYYSKSDFKAEIGVVHHERNFTTQITEGSLKDSDGNWVTKEPEFRFDYLAHKIGTGPLNYSAYAIYGKWVDDYKDSWHTEYYTGLWRDPIPLSHDKSLNLYLGTGMKWTMESYNDSTVRSWNYDITFGKQWKRVYAWTGYHFTQNNAQQLFDFGSVDLSKNLETGMRVKLDRLNTLQIVTSYDLENSRLYDLDYYWIRDLHCWQAIFEYREKRKEFKYEFHLKAW